MANCKICKKETEAWQIICEECWEGAELAYKMRHEKGELIERLKGQAKNDLLDIMRELCRKCPKFAEEVSDPACAICAFKEKEKLIRAFVE